MRSKYATHLCTSGTLCRTQIWVKKRPPSFLAFRRLCIILPCAVLFDLHHVWVIHQRFTNSILKFPEEYSSKELLSSTVLERILLRS